MKNLIMVGVVALLGAGCNPQQTPPPAQSQNASASTAAPPAEAATPAVTKYRVVNWGQQSTTAGGAFNVQRDGNSGLSFELNQPAPAGEIKATFDGKPLTGVVANGVIVTATIPTAYIVNAGRYPIALVLPTSPEPVAAGEFEVK